MNPPWLTPSTLPGAPGCPQAAELSVPNAYGALLSREGGVGLNAATSHDSTKYYVSCGGLGCGSAAGPEGVWQTQRSRRARPASTALSCPDLRLPHPLLHCTTPCLPLPRQVSLPANKAELWFALESARFQAPVFRRVCTAACRPAACWLSGGGRGTDRLAAPACLAPQKGRWGAAFSHTHASHVCPPCPSPSRELYSEKKVVAEERRLRVEGAPLGPFQEAFALASLGNNYRCDGWLSGWWV